MDGAGRLVAGGRTMAGGWAIDFARLGAEQLYPVAADIEAYPAFVPWCLATRILDRGENWLKVDNVFGAGPVRVRFTSHATLDPGRGLVIRSADGPFASFLLRWTFIPRDTGCRVEAAFEASFRSGLVRLLAGVSLPEAERRIVAAFRKRAEQLYGAG